MRRLLLCFLPLWLMARLYTPSPQPDLNWLEGCWHDADHPTTHLLWTPTDQQGARGLLTSEDRTTVLWVDHDGRLTVRELGAELTDGRPARQQSPVHQGPQELTYTNGCLRYLSSRSGASEFLLTLNGKSWALKRD